MESCHRSLSSANNGSALSYATSTTASSTNDKKMPLSRSLTQPQETIEYMVNGCDTLASIAARFQTTPSELTRINKITGRFVFPGQILYVPKRPVANVNNSVDGAGDQQVDCRAHDVPPNTPNNSSSPRTSSTGNSDSNLSLDQGQSPVPGHAQRVLDTMVSAQNQHQHAQLHQTLSSPISTFGAPSVTNPQAPPPSQSVVDSGYQCLLPPSNSKQRPPPTSPVFSSAASTFVLQPSPKPTPNQIDPADRECLERFLKINVRHITDGQGVVSGVLLVTPNALMFDPYVSDPLVIEHGAECYGVTVPIEFVLKTAIYSDIAHMRVKHAPESVPSVPKPAVYYASDDDSGCIFEENLLNSYGKMSPIQFDTIAMSKRTSSERADQAADEVVPALEATDIDYNDEQQKSALSEQKCDPANLETHNDQSNDVSLGSKCTAEEDNDESSGDVFKDALDGNEADASVVVAEDEHVDAINDTSCDDATSTQPPKGSSVTEPDNDSQSKQIDDSKRPNAANESTEQSENGDSVTKSPHSIDEQTNNDNQRSLEDGEHPLKERLTTTSIVTTSIEVDESATEMTTDSFDQSQSIDNNLGSMDECFKDAVLPDTDSSRNTNRLSSHFQAKLALSERHSAPLFSSENSKKGVPPPLVTAVSADESGQVTVNKRLSAHGESRREQMLKRLSNPVDAIGSLTKSGINSGINVTKSGFNATKSGISTGLNATKTGISSGFMATKTGITTGINVTKTGFNKVLSTPKNLMDNFSSKSSSKSDHNLSDHLIDHGGSRSKGKVVDSRQQAGTLGYTNMVDTKIDAFENFDKLIPRPSRINKDAPLYLCIRMGKYKKSLRKKNQRFSPTYSSFGRKKYEREYWFSVPKERARGLYNFFKKWSPEIYGDVDDLKGCDERGLEPLNTDDEMEDVVMGEECFEGDTLKDGAMRGLFGASGAGGGGGSEQDGNNSASQKMTMTLNTATNENNNKSRFWRRRSPLNFLKLVEDHFSTDGLSTDWNVSNSSEDHSFCERYMLELNNEPIMPDINGESELLTVEIIQNLLKHLPARAEGYGWTLIYSTSTHGFSLNTLYREMKHFDSPVLLLVEDTNGAKFGALLSTTIQASEHFYGTGETFLFTFHPEFACYPWTGENLFFIKGNPDSISIGAGEGSFGLWLDGDLYHGSSHPCKTFGNRTLSSEEDFVVKSIECWGFV